VKGKDKKKKPPLPGNVVTLLFLGLRSPLGHGQTAHGQRASVQSFQKLNESVQQSL
jgi:hypothetical protein